VEAIITGRRIPSFTFCQRRWTSEVGQRQKLRRATDVSVSGQKAVVPGAGLEPAQTFRSEGF